MAKMSNFTIGYLFPELVRSDQPSPKIKKESSDQQKTALTQDDHAFSTISKGSDKSDNAKVSNGDSGDSSCGSNSNRSWMKNSNTSGTSSAEQQLNKSSESGHKFDDQEYQPLSKRFKLQQQSNNNNSTSNNSNNSNNNSSNNNNNNNNSNNCSPNGGQVQSNTVAGIHHSSSKQSSLGDSTTCESLGGNSTESVDSSSPDTIHNTDSGANGDSEGSSPTAPASEMTTNVTECNFNQEPMQNLVRPIFSYNALIVMALRNAPNGRLTLQEIFAYIENQFAYYKQAALAKEWRNAVRHNLNLNKCFRKVIAPTGDDQNKKGANNYWTMDISHKNVFINMLTGKLCRCGDYSSSNSSSSIADSAQKHKQTTRGSLGHDVTVGVQLKANNHHHNQHLGHQNYTNPFDRFHDRRMPFLHRHESESDYSFDETHKKEQ